MRLRACRHVVYLLNIYIYFNVESLILIKDDLCYGVSVSVSVRERLILKNKLDELWVRAYIVGVCVYCGCVRVYLVKNGKYKMPNSKQGTLGYNC